MPPRRGSGSVRNPTVSAGSSANAPAGTISGRKTTTTCGSIAASAASSALGVAARAVLDERAAQAPDSPSRAHARKNVDWPTKATRSGARRDGSR